MAYVLRFEYMPAGAATPQKNSTGTLLTTPSSYDNEMPIPAVGDSVDLEVGGERQQYRVLTRHFTYSRGHNDVCIVFTDIGSAELSARSSDYRTTR